MPELKFQVERAEVVSFAVAPLLALKLRITCDNESENVQSIILRCQIQIETSQRRYLDSEKIGLLDLFGEPSRWDKTLRPLLWMNTSVVVPPFRGKTIVDLPCPCTFDFNVASTKYFAALEDGEIPLNLLFSGTVFYDGDAGNLQVEQIAWDKEAKFRLPVHVWKEMMDHYYPNTAWLCLRRDVFDLLARFKTEQGIPTWEETLETIIPDPERKSNAEVIVEGGVPS